MITSEVKSITVLYSFIFSNKIQIIIETLSLALIIGLWKLLFLLESLKTIYAHTREETRFTYLQSSPNSYTNLRIFYTPPQDEGDGATPILVHAN